MSRRYALDPLLALSGWTMTRVSKIAPCGGEEYRRRTQDGVTELIADRLAIAAGLHPWMIWPDWLDDLAVECAATDCAERFVRHPQGMHRRYCSATCRRRMNERTAWQEGRPSALRKAEYRRRYYELHGDYERARQRRYDQAKRSA